MSSGSASVGTSNRCDSTIWKASPARMCSLATSTIARYSGELVRREYFGNCRANTAAGSADGLPNCSLIASRRATAASYAASTRSSVASQFTALAINVTVPSW